MNGSNMSSYLEVPRDLPVAVYEALESGSEAPISWEDAQKEGVGCFAVRAVVTPFTTREVFVQLGAVPFSVEHMLKNYAMVYDEPFFPMIMLKIAKHATKVPPTKPGANMASSKFVKKVKLVAQDVSGVGLGMLPFFTASRFDPARELLRLPGIQDIRGALFGFMSKIRLPVVKTAATIAGALTVAVEGDKNAANVLRELRTPWSGLLQAAPARATPAIEGWSLFSFRALAQLAALTQGFGSKTLLRVGL